MRRRNRRKWSLQDWAESGAMCIAEYVWGGSIRLCTGSISTLIGTSRLNFMHQTLHRRVLQFGRVILPSWVRIASSNCPCFPNVNEFSPKYAYHAFSANDGLRAMNLVASATHWIIDLEGSVIRYASLYPDHAFKCSFRKSKQTSVSRYNLILGF